MAMPVKPFKPAPYNYLDITNADFTYGGFGSPTAGYINHVEGDIKSFGTKG